MGLVLDAMYTTAAAAASPLWLWRMWRKGKLRTDWRGRMGHAPALLRDHRPSLLLHAVSVGETNTIARLVEHLDKQTAGGIRIVIATTTDTGTARAKALFEPRFAVVRYPLDFSWAVKRFLDLVQPDVVANVELEVWPNFVQVCAERGIAVTVINGRLSERSFRGYRRLRPMLRGMFATLAQVGAQTQVYADRFEAMGVPADRITVTDTMKWDTAQVADTVEGCEALAQALGLDRGRPIVVAGSTAPGEEKLLLDTCPAAAQLVLVPRKPERFEAVAAMVPGIVRRSQHPDGTTRAVDGQRVFLLDSMGELNKAYALADVAVVGRSFLGLYGSNVMEPIALGKPTVMGPCYDDFADTVEAFVQAEGLVITEQPGDAIAQLLADPAAAAALAQRGRDVILSRQGATARTARLLLAMLHARAQAPAQPQSPER